MILFHFTGLFDILCCFSIDFVTFRYLIRHVDLNFGPKMAKISVFVKNDRLISVDWTLIIDSLIEPFCGLYTLWESVYPSIFHYINFRGFGFKTIM